MNLGSEQEVTNTRAKLARLEERYDALHNDTKSNQRVRELSMLSLKRLINQFKEEIARYEAHEREPGARLTRNGPAVLSCERELENTRQKLRELETIYEAKEKDTTGDDLVRQATMRSLKKYINQFKEEIARYEAHQSAR